MAELAYGLLLSKAECFVCRRRPGPRAAREGRPEAKGVQRDYHVDPVVDLDCDCRHRGHCWRIDRRAAWAAWVYWRDPPGVARYLLDCRCLPFPHYRRAGLARCAHP